MQEAIGHIKAIKPQAKIKNSMVGWRLGLGLVGGLPARPSRSLMIVSGKESAGFLD